MYSQPLNLEMDEKSQKYFIRDLFIDILNSPAIGKLLGCEKISEYETKCEIDISEGIWKHVITTLGLPNKLPPPKKTEIYIVRYNTPYKGRALYEEDAIKVTTSIGPNKSYEEVVYDFLRTSTHEASHLSLYKSCKNLIDNKDIYQRILPYLITVDEFLAGMSEVLLLPETYSNINNIPYELVSLRREEFERDKSLLCSLNSYYRNSLVELPEFLKNYVEIIRKGEETEYTREALINQGRYFAFVISLSDKHDIGLEFMKEAFKKMRDIKSEEDMKNYFDWFVSQIKKISEEFLSEYCKDYEEILEDRVFI